MKQSFGLIIVALASAATVSAQSPSYQGALVISRMSLAPPAAAIFHLRSSKYHAQPLQTMQSV